MKDIVNLLLKPFNKHTKQILLFFVVIIFGFNVQSQNIKAEGTVLSEESGQPIPGVSVVIKGSSIGTSTNFDGLYNIKVSKGDILVFSYLGMEEIEIIVNKASNNVVMKESFTGLDEIVVIGYGSVKKRELTGAIASVKAKEINKVITSDFASAIQGRIAGVSVRQGNAAPGENANITIRGITSFQDGGSGPLYVVDGVTYIENPNITPQEIESIEVLKDGASAAIYGSRASVISIICFSYF